MFFKWLLVTFAMVILFQSVATAKCGLGAAPSYDDIEAVRFARTWCLGNCPRYEVLFSNLGHYYVGRSGVDRHGTYESPDDKALHKAISVLQTHNFFSLNLEPHMVTDVPHYILAVQRCQVITKLDFAHFDDSRPDIVELFNALDAIVTTMKWNKKSDDTVSPLGLLDSIF